MIFRLRAELTTIDSRLGEYTALLERREQVRQAVTALEKLDCLPDVFLGSPPQIRITPNSPVNLGSLVERGVWTIAARRVPTSPSDAAIQVLREAGEPLHIREVIGRMAERGWFKDRDYESLRGTIAGTLDQKAKLGVIVSKPNPGTYGLIEWDNEAKDKTG